MKQDWTYKKLGEVADTYRGLTYSKKDEVEHSSKAVLRSNNIDLTSHQLNFDEIKYIREDFVIPQDKLVKKDSIFICMSNGSMQHLGKVAYIDKEYNFAFGGFMGLVVPKEIVNAKYVYYSMLADNFLSTIMKEGKGANINNLRFSDVENYLIPIPPLSIQRSIVRELDAIHGILEKKQEQLRELDNLAQAIFYDMFGDPITNPMGWQVKKLGDACLLVTDGSHYSPKADEKGTYPMLSVKDMKQDSFDYSFAKMVGENEYRKLVQQGCRPNVGDVLVAKDGSYFRYIFCVKEEKEQALLSSIAILRPSNVLDSEYLRYFLSTKYIFDLVEQNYLSGSALKRVILKGIKQIPISLPPLSLQQSFAAKVSAIEAQKQAITQSIQHTEALLAQRMDNYFGI